jgi:hypothetical protein
MRSLTPATHLAAFISFLSATSTATRKAALLLFSVAVLLAGGAAAARGQSALDGFDPNANGAVRFCEPYLRLFGAPVFFRAAQRAFIRSESFFRPAALS